MPATFLQTLASGLRSRTPASAGCERRLNVVIDSHATGNASRNRADRPVLEGVPVMAATVADVLLSRLREWEVDQVFAYPGDGINGLLAAWGRAKDEPQF